jgi:type III secretion protein J
MNTSRYWAAMGLVVMLLTGCKETVNLQVALSDQEANEIITVLNKDGITTGKHVNKDGVAVTIADSDLPRATSVLEAHGLPHRRQARMGDVFKKDGLISTPMEERARYMSALSQELEYTLAQIEGVVVARVHLVLPEKVAPGEPVLPSSASVLIKYAPSLDPDVIAPRVRTLVARAVPGLGGAAGQDKVSVVFVEGKPEPAKPVESDGVAGHGVQLRLLALAVLLLAAGGFAASFAGNPKLNAWLARFKRKPVELQPEA